MFSESNLPTSTTLFMTEEFAISLSSFMLERVQIDIDELEFPKKTSSGIGKSVLQISPAIFLRVFKKITPHELVLPFYVDFELKHVDGLARKEHLMQPRKYLKD